MTLEAQELLKKALALPDNERSGLAGTLIDSLNPAIDEDVDAAWQTEIARRLEQIRSGEVKTVPWSEVSERGRALLRETATRF